MQIGPPQLTDPRILSVGSPRPVENPAEASFDLSASQIDVFAGPNGCEAKWGFQYISRLPRKESASAAKGTALHKIQERYLKDGLYPADQNDPLAKLAMAGWQHLPDRLTVDPRLVEGAFRLPRDGIFWRGAIDLLHLASGQPWVLDHKTTGNAKYALTPTTIRENIQANVYTWAVGQLTRRESIRLRWVYYDTNTVKKTWPVDATLTAAEADRFLRAKIDGPAKRATQLLRERPDPQTLRKNPAACGAYGGCPYSGLPCKLDTSAALVALFGLPSNQEKGSSPMMQPPGFPPPPPSAAPSAPMASPSAAALGDLLARAQGSAQAPPVMQPPADLAAALAAMPPPAPPPPMPPPPAAIVAPPPPEQPPAVHPSAPKAEPPRGTWFRDDYGRDVYGCLHCPAWLLPEDAFGKEDRAGACPHCKQRTNQFDGGHAAISQRFNPPMPPAPPGLPPAPPGLPPAPPGLPPAPPGLPPAPPGLPPARPRPMLAPPAPAPEEKPAAKKRGRPAGSKNKRAETIDPRQPAPTEIGTLYVGCTPDDDSATPFVDFLEACHALIRTNPEHASVQDWRQIDYGKGAAVLAISVRHVQFGACDLYVSDPHDPSFVILRGALESMADRIVRATV